MCGFWYFRLYRHTYTVNTHQKGTYHTRRQQHCPLEETGVLSYAWVIRIEVADAPAPTCHCDEVRW
jgi:hypothetical protein